MVDQSIKNNTIWAAVSPSCMATGSKTNYTCTLFVLLLDDGCIKVCVKKPIFQHPGVYLEHSRYFQQCTFLKLSTFTRLPGEKKRVKHKVTRQTEYKRKGSHPRTEGIEEKQNPEEMMRKYRRNSAWRMVFTAKTILKS